jgi:hypothetical protein
MLNVDGARRKQHNIAAVCPSFYHNLSKTNGGISSTESGELSKLILLTWRNRIGYPAQPGLIRPSVCLSVRLYTWRNQIGYPAQPRLICPSVCPSVCTYLQIRYSAENGTGPTDSVKYSSKS